MIADYFWKIIFTALIIVGFVYWKDWRDQSKEYEGHVAAMAELLDHSDSAKPFNDDEAASRIFQSIYLLQKMEEHKGEKFSIDKIFEEAQEDSNNTKVVNNLLRDAFRQNYKKAKEYGLLEDEDAMSSLMDGTSTLIISGPWQGEELAVGHYISPNINDAISLHLTNRLLLPQSVKLAMQFADITNDVKERADRLKRAGILDVGSFDSIKQQYDTLRELSTRNN
ncbi:hypothetical protein OAF65_07095 [Verrucomicrobiales bacterium]|nr:hypothetical protein [Verrucomicrobiales bacterium]